MFFRKQLLLEIDGDTNENIVFKVYGSTKDVFLTIEHNEKVYELLSIIEEIKLDDALKIRDFLNYALPNTTHNDKK